MRENLDHIAAAPNSITKRPPIDQLRLRFRGAALPVDEAGAAVPPVELCCGCVPEVAVVFIVVVGMEVAVEDTIAFVALFEPLDAVVDPALAELDPEAELDMEEAAGDDAVLPLLVAEGAADEELNPPFPPFAAYFDCGITPGQASVQSKVLL